MLKRLRSLFRALTSRRAFEAGMTEELRFHIEQYTDDLVRSGVPREEARRRSLMEFGGLNSIKGDCRDARGLHPFDELDRQLRYAFRLLRKSPGFTATALLTLALCIGANLTIFAAIDSILLRPLPFPNAGRLVTVFNTYPKAGVERDGSSLTNYYERRGRLPAFSSLSIYRYGTAIVGEPGSTVREQITQVSPDFFATLGVGPIIGRTFNEEETTYRTNHVAILSDVYWRQHFSSDPKVIGRQIRVDGFPTSVIGILPPGFRFLSSEARLYFPLASRLEDRAALQRHSGGNVTQMIARLSPRATLAQAQSQIDAQNATLETDDPQAKMMADAGFRSLVVPLHADHVAAIRPTLLLLQAGVLTLLLIGAVNLVNLLLIRANGRIKELAVRQALGASRRYIVSEAVVETTLLTLAGGLLGLAVGAGGIRLLAILGADRLPLGAHIAFNTRLAMVALIGAVLMGIVLAAPIIWFNLRRHLGDALQSETRGGTTGRAAQTLRHSFIMGQIALAFVLLAGAGLLGVSLKRAMAVSPGFRASHVLTGQISLVGNKYPAVSAALTFIERLVDELDHQPGVLAAGVVTNVPFSGRNGKSAAKVKDHVLRPGESPRGHYSYGVGGDYFRAMGFSLRAGRFLTAADSRRPQRVCVVDDDFARYYWPNESPLGHRLFQDSEAGPDAEAFTVVGVVGSAKQAGLTDDTAQGAVYYPYTYHSDNNIFVVMRAAPRPESLQSILQTVVRQIDPDLPVTGIQSMESRIDDSLVARRSPTLLAGLFSGIALLLTAIGTYGVLSYSVAQRRREIGVRMALGARPDQIRSQFFFLALRLLAGGTLFGLLGAWLTGRAMQTVLFHVPAFNSATFAAAAGIIAAISLVACLLPACRAARISPMQALLLGLVLFLPLSGLAQSHDSRRPWKGYAILGNGNLTAVYSDDERISAVTHHKGIQHFYFKDYTADYVASTTFDLLDRNGRPVPRAAADMVGMKNFFTTQTQARLRNGAAATTLCFIHSGGAAVLSLGTQAADGNSRYRFQTLLQREIKTDRDIRLTSLQKENGMAVAVWSNGTALAIAPESPADQVSIDEATISLTGTLRGESSPAQVLLAPASSASGAIAKVQSLRQEKDLEAAAGRYWNDWMNRGALPAFPAGDPHAAEYLEAYKRNLYCLKSANLNGQIPADITGQFVTNNMPQLYPRDAMMCTRVLLLTNHAAEAKQVIEFWATPRIPMKTPGEWYARYDANGRAVNGGSGARFDEPEWDSNGYYIYLLNQYHAKMGVWLANPEFIYRLADFLVNHLSPNGLLWEGGIVEWTGYLPATNMIDAAALRIAAKMAHEFGDQDRAERYSAAAQKISAALPEMFDKSRQTYADVRFTEQKAVDGASLTKQSGPKTYLWDTTANVGVIWGYPNHREIELSNDFYRNNTVKLGGGMQYFDSPDPGLAGYGHGVFFFTTAAAAEYQTSYGKKSSAKDFLEWMIRNANSYGLMPEHILPDGSDCSPASPLSWCSAEFVAALLLWTQS